MGLLDRAQYEPAEAHTASPNGGAASPAPIPPRLVQAKRAVHQELLNKHADTLDAAHKEEVRSKVAELVDDYIHSGTALATQRDRERLIQALLDDICGLGPLQELVDNPDISEIMVNNYDQVYVEHQGRIVMTEVKFDDERHLLQVIDRVVSSVGRHIDEANPYVDARLPDGSRVNVIIPPLSLKGPVMTIRKFAINRLTYRDLIELRSATPEMLDFLHSAVRAGLNVLISGGSGAGKTTLLNVLSSFIPEGERIITIEDAAELQLQQPHVITLESRPANVEGSGEVTIRDLVKNCLRMRPDRIIVGEVRGGEALDMLQAMNTGHDGSMSTIHANSPQEAMSRLETLVLMAGTELPSRAIREQIAYAIHIIVQQQRLRGGPRRIVSIAEVTGLDERTGSVQLQELFVFRQLGVSRSGQAVGYHTATGKLSCFFDRLREAGEEVPPSLFQPVSQPAEKDLY